MLPNASSNHSQIAKKKTPNKENLGFHTDRLQPIGPRNDKGAMKEKRHRFLEGVAKDLSCDSLKVLGISRIGSIVEVEAVSWM